MQKEKAKILTPDFFKSAYLVLKTSAWAGKEWDRQLEIHLEEARKTGKLTSETEEVIRFENTKTECGRDGVAGIVWNTMNKNRYPSREVSKRITTESSWHLFAIRVADNWVDEGVGGCCLDRLNMLQPNRQPIEVDHPLAAAAAYLLQENENRFNGRRGYKEACNRLFNLVKQVETGRTTLTPEQLEVFDKEVCFMTVFPLVFLTESFSGKPTRIPTLALREMLHGARMMDYLGDIKKDYYSGDSYNGILHRARKEKPNGDYKEIRQEVERIKPEIVNATKKDLQKGARGLEPVAAGMYWFASMLMYGKYLAQYELLTKENSDGIAKVARKCVRSL